MWYRLSLFLTIALIFAGCSSKDPSYYEWKVTNTIIHDKVLNLKDIKVREIKYYTTSKKNWKDGTTSYTNKEDKYAYLNPSDKLDIHNNSFNDKSKKYKQVILFKGNSQCKEKEYPCSFERLRLKGEVFEKSKRSHTLTRNLTLSSPIRIKSEKDMRDKVYNFLVNL